MNKFEEMDSKFAVRTDLGAIYTQKKTEFKVWSPTADSVCVNLYRDSVCEKPYSVIDMKRENGVWSAEAEGDLHGVYYTYSLTFGNKTNETIDIYARAAGANGLRGMVVDMERTNPEGWEDSQYVELNDYLDAVLYELHVRDFSSDESGSFKFRGKFKAFTETGVTNSYGDKIGLEYIKELGVTHIHLLPVFDYGSVDETSAEPQFNWGYDPVNYNLPEGSYSTDPSNGITRITEFKELIAAAHKLNIGVIMDVVYNHTYSADDSPFNLTVPGYYYRHNEDGSLSDGSACGNEFASEREMARKFIIDSLCMWAEEYKIDGFRFDLMGLLDIKTLDRCSEILRSINPSVILYGEGWTGGESPLDEKLRAMKKNSGRLHDFAMFSDDFRDGLKGSVFIEEDVGYVNGGADSESAEMIKALLRGRVNNPYDWENRRFWAYIPQQTVNYVEAHDNLTLYDKLHVSCPDADEESIIKMDKFAAALIFISQGIPFIQAGQEMLRTKPLPGGGYDDNSYKSPDLVNSIKWNRITEHKDVVDYYRGLIALRKKYDAFRIFASGDIYEFISFRDLGGGAVVMLIDDLTVIINPTDKPVSWSDSGLFMIYADDEAASIKPLYSKNYLEKNKLTAKPRSILFAEKRFDYSEKRAEKKQENLPDWLLTKLEKYDIIVVERLRKELQKFEEKKMQFTNDIKYIGVNDHDIDLFEGQYTVPNGMAYNSYAIIDEKIAVMDTVDARFGEEWAKNLGTALNGRDADYLVVQHMEPDHSGNIILFSEMFPKAKIVASKQAFVMMKQFLGTDFSENRIVVGEGSTLELGRHTLKFIAAPMVHWPEVMMTYDETEKALFSADAFGKFGAWDAPDDWECEARRYYFGIVGKYGAQVQAVLKKASSLQIERILPLHGPVLTENIGHYVDLYNTWSSYGVESEGVAVAYTSVYGHTKEAVEELAEKLRELGCPKVAVTDLARDDIFEAVEDAFRYGKLVLATTTYNTDIFPQMRAFIEHLTERNFQNRTVGIIENGSWAPNAAKVIKGMLAEAKDITFTNTTVTIKSAMSGENDSQLDALARELI